MANQNTLIKEQKGDQSFRRIYDYDAMLCLVSLTLCKRPVNTSYSKSCLINEVDQTMLCMITLLSHCPKEERKLQYQKNNNLPFLLCQSLKKCWKGSVRKDTMQWKKIADREKLSVLPHICGHRSCPTESSASCLQGLLSSFSRGSSLTQKLTPSG